MTASQFFSTKITDTHLVLIAVALCIPAFTIHLGLIGFIGDEAIRSLVAFEMHQSGNFIVPTLNGELYFNKPPLYNWILYVASMLAGSFGEWPARCTTLFFLSVYAFTVFHFFKKYVDRRMGIVMAFMLLTSGRILFWDSMLGLIDICFSAVIFLQFMLLYHWSKTAQWNRMFISAYFLFAVGFMLKGLPAVVFLVLSLIATLWFFKQLKKQFFSKAHALGILTAAIPLLIYYLLYAQEVSLAEVFATLTDQSMERTATHHGLGKTAVHLFTFPFEQIYHFLPWSVIVFAGLIPGARQWIRQHAFISFCLLMLVVNLPVYWLSVGVYPRYLLMFIPLVHGVGYFLLRQSLTKTSFWWKSYHYLFVAIAAIAVIGLFTSLFLPALSGVLHLGWAVTISCLIVLFALCGMWYDPARTFIWMMIALLGVRIFFDLAVLPVRAKTAQENTTRADAARLAAAHGDKTWYIYGETETHQVARFYTAVSKGEIIRITDRLTDKNAYYIVDTSLYPTFPGEKIDSLILERGQVLYVMDSDSLRQDK